MQMLLRPMKYLMASLIGLAIFSLLLLGVSALDSEQKPTIPGCFFTSGNKIMNAANQEIRLSGLNWFGFETPSNAPHGLEVRNWRSILTQIKDQGYGVIRLPFSNAMLEADVKPSNINYTINPDLEGLTSLQVMDKIIGEADALGLRIILDNHRSTSGTGPESGGLWHTDEYPESTWISDWKDLALRYKNNGAVIGIDLRNEPYGACWGCGDISKDWRLAAERAGNAVLSVNSNLLIIVQGVSGYDGQYTWWGGNLMGAKDYPVRLDVPDRLVYSIHEYPETIFPQAWFSASDYPENLPAVWDEHWGYLVKENIAPVLIGEFGTRYETAKDKLWLQAFRSYIQRNKLNWIFWSLNPDSGDTGGLLLDDWLSIHTAKQDILKQIQYPLIESNCTDQKK